MKKFGTRNPADYDTKELQAGINVEKEHRALAEHVQYLVEVVNAYRHYAGIEPEIIITVEDIFREIAMDHLDEHPGYYIALDEMEAVLSRMGA